MSDFNKALKTVFDHEGGFVDNPNDRGGPTNFGITMATATAYLDGEPASREFIKNLSPQVAGAIYRKLFWTPLGLDSIPNEILATILFDLAVLRGVPSVVRALQTVCQLKVDGVMGPETKKVVGERAIAQPSSLALEVVLHCQYLCADFVAKNPTQLEFLVGWISRTQELIRMAALI